MTRSRLVGWAHRALSHPQTRGLQLDDPITSDLRRGIIEGKPMLRRVYERWYEGISSAMPGGDGGVLEIGSGPGFVRKFVPEAIASDVFLLPRLSTVMDARRIPFRTGCLRAILMVNVFHHIPDVEEFLREAARCVRPGGALIMVEPWITTWSKFVFSRFHHEPIDVSTKTWSFPGTGPLSDANIALPWIVFERDRALFESAFGEWRIEEIEVGMPLQYLLTGGVGYRAFVPSQLHPVVRLAESGIERIFGTQGMVAQIRLVRTDEPAAEPLAG